MSRSLGIFFVVLIVVACNPAPSASPPTIDAARLNVTGSGPLCGPWWFGCGAVLVVEAPGWTLPADWAPDLDDTHFATAFSRNMERTRVTGIRGVAQDRIEPGDYAFVVIKTTSPDDEPQGTLHPAFGCSEAVNVPAGTRAVNVDVQFDGQPGCSITVSMDAQ